MRDLTEPMQYIYEVSFCSEIAQEKTLSKQFIDSIVTNF